MKKYLLSAVLCGLFASFTAPVWSASIAFIGPRNIFAGGLDPINFPEDVPFVLDLMFAEEPGLEWLYLHLTEELGHEVYLYNSDTDVAADIEAQHDLVLITEAIASGTVAGDYLVSTIPVLFFEAFILDDMGVGAGISGRSHASQVHVLNTNHPVTQGIPENATLTTNDPLTGEPALVTFATFTKASSPSNAILVEIPSAVIGEDSRVETNIGLVLAFDTNSSAGNLARWVFLGYSDETPEVEDGGNPELRTMTALNEFGVRLLDNSVAWLLGETTSVQDWSIQ